MTDFELNVKEEGFYKGEPCDDFMIHLESYHPGVPGYSVAYKYYIVFKGERISPRGCNIRADYPDVYFKSDEIIIPDATRQRGGWMTVDLHCAEDPDYTAKLKIKLRKYEMTLEDNFETFNTDIWNALSGVSKKPMVYRRAKENYVRDNKLCLDFEKCETPIVHNGIECYYSDAGVSTKDKFSQKYGCFSTRMRVPATPTGIFSAFWLMPQGRYREDYFFKRTDTGDEFHGCSEIDIMEIFHYPATRGSAHTEHYWEPGWDPKTQPITKSSLGIDYTIPGYKDGEYQEYACVWNEYALYYYVNGTLAKVNDKIAPVEDVFPAYILYTCYLGPEGSGAFWGEVKDEDLPQSMMVDWLRVYK